MKKIRLLILPIAIIMISSCNRNLKSADQKNQDSIAMADSLKTKILSCYEAVSNADSALLKLEEINGEIQGELSFNFAEKEDTFGTVRGAFKGDTLFVDYNYTLNGTTYKNPQAFLRKGDQLIQGRGEISTYLGRTTFSKDTPIDFKQGFVFNLAECK
ncbi:hypothetical protein [Pedobacter cryophilus]|uniref:Lipoprotein n=1 Tax=Pedobacter cryophilus TaxID=2571271 RepID=A0A4U1C054_9SPHI|nr:hypothetical protein [Pedobacter cryophilus]TKB98852.1 hypothetical protein FA046_06985 [Pedobacter cryophilus]